MPAPPNRSARNGLRVQCAQTIMRSAEDKAALARTVLSYSLSGLLADEPSSDKPLSGQPAVSAADQP
jgi:hypothetical protein